MLSQEDLTPPKDVVNPEHNPSGSKANWTIVEAAPEAGKQGQGPQTFRVLHLHGNDSHARFLTGAKPGHYAITVTLELQISPSLGETDREKFREDGLGWLRVALGTLNDKKAFYGGRYLEDAFQSVSLTEEELPHKLLKYYWWDVVRIPLDQQYIQIYSDVVLTVEGDHELDTDLGLILQWSNMVAFQTLDDSVVKVIVTHVRSVTSSLLQPSSQSLIGSYSTLTNMPIWKRLDDMLDPNEPLVRAPAPTAIPPTPQTSSPSQPEPPKAEKKDDGEELSVDDWIQALTQVQQEVQDAQQRAALEAIMMQRLKQEEQKRQDAVIGMLYLNAALQNHTREQEEKQKQEQEQEQALRLLRLLGSYY